MSSAYEYRRLSPKERERVVQQRRERGYPRHAPPHPFRHAGHYFITAVNYEHANIMATPERRTEFEDHLLSHLAEIGAELGAWVILPNHYHVEVGVASLDDISHVLQHVHGSTARAWNLADGCTGRRRVWYKFQDRVIRDEAHFHRAINYIHYNPVKHGYVDSPYDWPWASLETYESNYGRDWLREQWKRYTPSDDAQEWHEP